MNEPIVIEVVTSVDQDLIEAMERLVPQLPGAAPPTREQLQVIVGSRTTALLVARDPARGGQIVGTLALAVFRIPTGVRAWIEDVVVDSIARGKGIGEALSREALRVAASRGAQTVDLTSRPSKEAANRLYQRIGFRIRRTNLYRYDVAAAERTG